MSIQQIPKVSEDMKLEDLINLVAILIKEVSFLFDGNIDAKNVRAKSITADRIKADKLSAISADLGHITAGLIEAVTIIGSQIKTANSGKRVEISSSENLFRAINDAGYDISIVPEHGLQGNPAILLQRGPTKVYVYLDGGTLYIEQANPMSIVITGHSTYLNGESVYVNDWSKLKNYTTGRTLQQELGDGAGSGYTGEFSVVTGIDFGQNTYTLRGLRFVKGVLVETW